MLAYLVQHNCNKHYQLDTSLRSRSCCTQCNTISWKKNKNSWVTPSCKFQLSPMLVGSRKHLKSLDIQNSININSPTHHSLPTASSGTISGSSSHFLRTIQSTMRICSILMQSAKLESGNKFTRFSFLSKSILLSKLNKLFQILNIESTLTATTSIYI